MAGQHSLLERGAKLNLKWPKTVASEAPKAGTSDFTHALAAAVWVFGACL